MAISALSQSALDEKEDKKKKGKKKGTTSSKSSFVGELTSGLGVGLGTSLPGIALGTAAGAIDKNRAKNEAIDSDPNRPERRRLTKARDAVKGHQKTRERAMATLSQAVFDWAAAIR